MLEQHSASPVQFLAGFRDSVVLDVAGLGMVRFCHGSPRSDTELVTPGTPMSRPELARLIPERTLVTGHTHVQLDRTVTGVRSVNAGSVGPPYHDAPLESPTGRRWGPVSTLDRRTMTSTSRCTGVTPAATPAQLQSPNCSSRRPRSRTLWSTLKAWCSPIEKLLRGLHRRFAIRRRRCRLEVGTIVPGMSASQECRTVDSACATGLFTRPWRKSLARPDRSNARMTRYAGDSRGRALPGKTGAGDSSRVYLVAKLRRRGSTP